MQDQSWASVAGAGPVFEFLRQNFHFTPGRAVPTRAAHGKFLASLPPEARAGWTYDRFTSELPFACPHGRVPGWRGRRGIGNVSEVRPAPNDPPGRLLTRHPLKKYDLIRTGDTARPLRHRPRTHYRVVMAVAGLPGPGGRVVRRQRAASAGGAARAAVGAIERCGGVVTSIRVQ